MISRNGAAAALVLGMASVIAGPAPAALFSYTDRSAFETATGGTTGAETFDAFTADASFQSTAVVAGFLTITGEPGSNGSETNKIDAPGFEFGGAYAGNGTAYLIGDVRGSQQIRIDFADGVTAWGGDFIGFANGPRNTKIFVYDAADTLLGTLAPSLATSFHGFGLTGAVAAYLVIGGNTGSNDAFGLDDVAWRAVTQIVEPGALGLFGLGLVATGLAARRRSG